MPRKSEIQVVPGLGARLNDALFRRGVGRRQLARLSGISHDTVNQALNDRATRRTIDALESALGLTAGELTDPTAAALPHTETTHLVPASLLRAYDAQVQSVAQDFAAAAERAGLGPRFLLAVLDAYERISREDQVPLPPAYWAIRQRAYDASIGGDPSTATMRVRERLSHDE